MPIDKNQLLEKLAEQISGNADTMGDAAQNARQASIDAPGRNQTRYDSSKEEQGYLADGLNIRHAELCFGASMVKSTRLPMNPGKVVVGSLVKLNANGNSGHYFVLPYGGGQWIETEEGEVTVVTPESPLYRAMEGRRAGETFRLNAAKRTIDYTITEIA